MEKKETNVDKMVAEYKNALKFELAGFEEATKKLILLKHVVVNLYAIGRFLERLCDATEMKPLGVP